MCHFDWIVVSYGTCHFYVSTEFWKLKSPIFFNAQWKKHFYCFWFFFDRHVSESTDGDRYLLRTVYKKAGKLNEWNRIRNEIIHSEKN